MEYRVDWVAKYGKMGEKYPLWAFFDDMYRYTLLYFDQSSYFIHKLLISYPI